VPETVTRNLHEKFGAFLLKSLDIAGVKLLQAVHKTHTTLLSCLWFSWVTFGLFFKKIFT